MHIYIYMYGELLRTARAGASVACSEGRSRLRANLEELSTLIPDPQHDATPRTLHSILQPIHTYPTLDSAPYPHLTYTRFYTLSTRTLHSIAHPIHN